MTVRAVLKNFPAIVEHLTMGVLHRVFELGPSPRPLQRTIVAYWKEDEAVAIKLAEDESCRLEQVERAEVPTTDHNLPYVGVISARAFGALEYLATVLNKLKEYKGIVALLVDKTFYNEKAKTQLDGFKKQRKANTILVKWKFEPNNINSHEAKKIGGIIMDKIEKKQQQVQQQLQ